MSTGVKINELPSGNFNAKVFDYTDATGKRHYKSITAPSKREVKKLIADFLSARDEKKASVPDMTVGEAIDKYIEIKSNILSASTIRGYKRMRDNNLQSLMPVKLSKLTQEIVQIEINEEAASMSAKTVRNIHGLLSSALAVYLPGLKLNTTLPMREKNEIQIPTEEEIAKIIKATQGTEMEIPILLAAFCGLRESEIGGLTWNDIDLDNKIMTIKTAKVLNENGIYVEKGTKSIAGTRTIRIFDKVYEALCKVPDKKGNVLKTMKPHNLYHRFVRLQKRIGIPHYRFHDLRHYTVSVMLSLNIPKNYIADYIGHENLIDKIYGHIMQKAKLNFMDKANEYFSNVTLNAP
jgi:integrase